METNGLYQCLQRGACHLWYWQFGSVPERGLSLLSDEELARYRRFGAPEAARTFAAARMLVRSLLSAYGNLTPNEWCFLNNEWGKPSIANPEAPDGFTFNLSHKTGFITCLVGCGRELGVDVEDLEAHHRDLGNLASRFFSPIEAAELEMLPSGRQRERFFELWTLKESYIKARGRGLSLGLSKFTFTVEGTSAKVRFAAEFDDNPARWDFRLFRPDPRWLIATSIERCGHAPVEITMMDGASAVMSALGQSN